MKKIDKNAKFLYFFTLVYLFFQTKSEKDEKLGTPQQTSQVDSVQDDAAMSQPTTESSKSLNEMIGPAQEASTENVKQTIDEGTTQSSSKQSENDDDGMVGMALPSANQATAEQTDEKVSAPLETPKDDSQTLVDEKVRQNMIKFDTKNELKLIALLFFR